MNGIKLDEIAKQGQYASIFFRHFNGTGVTGIFPCENTALAFLNDEFNEDGCSCQASSVCWASYALDGHYDHDPHLKCIGKVEKLNQKLPKTWNWSSPSGYAGEIAKLAQKARLGSVPIGKGDRMTMLERIYPTRGVYVMVAEDQHCLAAATNAYRGVYHYDNEIGCARCVTLDSWKNWVKWCGDVWSEEKDTTWHVMQLQKL